MTATAPDQNVSSRRFAVALSFSGEHRDFVAEVARHLAARYSEDRVLYDQYHDAEFARPDLNTYLPDLYRTHSDLIVLFLCSHYSSKHWCRLEWRHVRQLLSTVDDQRIMFLSFGSPGDLSAAGILPGDGYIDVSRLTPKDTAAKIVRRRVLNDNASTAVDPDTHKSIAMRQADDISEPLTPLELNSLAIPDVGTLLLTRDNMRYTRCEVGVRIESALRWEGHRVLTVFASTSPVTHIVVGSTPSVAAEVVFHAIPADVGRFVDVVRPNDPGTRKVLYLSSPIDVGTARTVTIRSSVRFSKQPRKAYCWRSSSEADVVHIRVVFVRTRPLRAGYRVYDLSGDEIESGNVDLDALSWELIKTFPNTRAHIIYELWWD